MLSLFATYKPLIAKTITAFLDTESRRLGVVNRRSARLVKHIGTTATRGKMVRGGLVCLGYTLGGNTITEDCLKLAAAMELAHTALLIHDDIMDGDTLRRGKPAVHAYYRTAGASEHLEHPERFGVATAICLADMAFFWAFNLTNQALASSPSLLTAALSLLTEELAMVGAAQLEDVYSGHRSGTSSLRTILNTYRYKTARYTFSLPLMLGARAGGSDEATAQALGVFGEHLGIVFQIHDDEIGLFGTEQEIGKPIGSDIRERKKTLYHYFLYHFASTSEKKRLDALFGNPKITLKDLALVHKLIEIYAIPTHIERIIQHEVAQARHALDSLSLSKENRTLFEEIILYTEQRFS